MSEEEKTPGFIPDRLNVDPVVLAGCTANEVQYLFILGIFLGGVPTIMLGFIGNSWYITIPFGFLFLLIFIVAGMKTVSTLKRGKPQNYITHKATMWMSTQGWVESDMIFKNETFKGIR